MQQVAQSIEQRSFSGPVPSPETLQEYRAVDPSIPERIFAHWEAEQAHRHDLDRMALRASIEAAERDDAIRGRGQWFALSFALGGLLFAATMAALGYPITGAVMGALDLVGIVGIFVTGSRRRNVRPKTAEPAEERGDDAQLPPDGREHG